MPVVRELGSVHIEIDPLRQRQVLRIINRVGRAAHVIFPGVGAGFSAAAGALLAAEGTADFCAAGANVDVGDAAVGALWREEKLGFAHVVGEDGAGEALRDFVVDADRFVERVIADDVEDGGEGFVFCDRSIRAYLDQGGFDVIGIFGLGRRTLTPTLSRRTGRGGRRNNGFAAGDEVATLLEDGVAHVGEGGLVDEGADEDSGLARIANGEILVDGFEAVNHFLLDGIVNDEAAEGCAALAGGAGGGEDDGSCGEVEIGGGSEDHGVVAAEFEEASS